MKSIITIFLVTILIGCSSTDDRIQSFLDSAAACSTVCKQHPDINEISSATAGGIPLFIMGGMKTNCRCK